MKGAARGEAEDPRAGGPARWPGEGSLPRAPQRLHPVIGAWSSGCARVFRDQMSQATARLATPRRCGPGDGFAGQARRRLPAGPPVGVPANRDPSDVPIRMGSRVAQTTLKASPVPVEAATVFSLPRVRSERARGDPSSGRHRPGRRLPSHPSTAPSAGPERRCKSSVEVGPDFGLMLRRRVADASLFIRRSG
jgi:hypothetical protein